MSTEAMKQAEKVLMGCLEHPDAQDAITDLSAAIEAAEKQEPVAWSITCDGEHCGNFFFRECDAVELHKRLNLKYPNKKREVVSLYTHPPAAPAAQPAPVQARLTVDALRVEFEKKYKGSIGATRLEGGIYLSPAVHREWIEFVRVHTTPPAAAQPAVPAGYVPISDDLKSVFIEGCGEIALAWPPAAQPAAEPDALHIAAMELVRAQAARIAELEALLAAPPEAPQPAPLDALLLEAKVVPGATGYSIGAMQSAYKSGYAACAVLRKPLTDPEIDELLRPFPRNASEWSMTDFRQFAQAAHGITKGSES
jgi:hypothetical protein